MISDCPKISIVIPVLNEADVIESTLSNPEHINLEVIVVDGGSSDETLDIISQHQCKMIDAAAGRANQMNKGADAATGDILIFLHADSVLPAEFDSCLCTDFWSSEKSWGRFDVRLSGTHPLFRIIEGFMNNRSRLTGICTGDQAIFVKREAFAKIGGFAPIPLMEDIEISKSLKKISPPFCIKSRLVTSSRRWEKNGIIKTILLMWKLRLMYFAGVKSHVLAKHYSKTPAPS